VRAPAEAVLGQRMEPPELAAPDAAAPTLDVPGSLGPGIGGVAATAVGTGTGVGVGQGGPLAFSAEQGMTEPRRIAGADPVYTRAALAAGVEGTLVAQCVITAGGAVEDCRIVKGLPHLDRAVLDALRHQRYAPVTYRGQPVAVSYVFTFRMVIPAR
jgi:TonB family protein